MKVHIIIYSPVDESTKIIKVYKNKADAEKHLNKLKAKEDQDGTWTDYDLESHQLKETDKSK